MDDELVVGSKEMRVCMLWDSRGERDNLRFEGYL